MAEVGRRVADRIVELVEHTGTALFISVCVDLLEGAPREEYVEELRALTGHAWSPGDPVFDRTSWGDFWVRSWGARGLLHVWHESAGDSVVTGLGDEHDRPAEMCLKVVARHDVAGAGDGAARLATHPLARVRVQALRALAVVGDTEHVSVVQTAHDDPDPDVRRQAIRALAALETRLDL